jgi:hypothetical protein
VFNISSASRRAKKAWEDELVLKSENDKFILTSEKIQFCFFSIGKGKDRKKREDEEERLGRTI